MTEESAGQEDVFAAEAEQGPPAGEPAPAAVAPFNLFVYGTLTSATVFRAVLGRRMVLDPAAADGVHAVLAREAVLPGYEKVSPDNTYLYAVPHPQGRIRGLVIGPLDGECMDALEHYEGRNYRRVQVEVRTAADTVTAYAFVADTEQISHTFGYEFRDRLKQEVLLRNKIDKLLADMQGSADQPDTDVERRALTELHGSTIRDLVRQHFESGGISNFYIRQALGGEPLRDYHHLVGQALPRPMATAYISLVINQVLFNQVEERIRDEFRYELDRMHVSDRFYERTISALATLHLLNENQRLLDILVGDALADVPFDRAHLIEFVRWAIRAADAVYDSGEAGRHLRFIHTHMGRGAIPLGAEVEFSNIGHAVIAATPDAPPPEDPFYDGFRYFSDFALDILMWKLGGHVDDHREKISNKPKRGFLEFAFGNLSIAANLSKPITDDPWLLNQIIQQTMRFYPVRPHSVHISLQMPHDRAPDLDAVLPLGAMKCLFALFGDPRRDTEGRLRLSRLIGNEIVTRQPTPQLMFSSVARRRSEWHEDDFELDEAHAPLVQQFKFMRLSPAINYETAAMAMKGLQLTYNPGSFLTAAQTRRNPALRALFDELLTWGERPAPLEQEEIDTFLNAVYDGLMKERNGRPAHGEAYIGFCIDHLRSALETFNSTASR
jgi:gamma-glutamylcyclotransferase (GGCT)/AIG2-like uncharacterized protein YtfP